VVKFGDKKVKHRWIEYFIFSSGVVDYIILCIKYWQKNVVYTALKYHGNFVHVEHPVHARPDVMGSNRDLTPCPARQELIPKSHLVYCAGPTRTQGHSLLGHLSLSLSLSV
jgi:hypothetical protein